MIVSDTNIFINLLKVESVELLHKLYNQIYVPQAVFDELSRKNDKCFNDVKNADFINIFSLSKENTEKAERIRSQYFLNGKEINEKNKTKHLGESQAIVLLIDTESSEKLFLSDDSTARTICLENDEIKQYGIYVTGTLGIIKQAYKENYIKMKKALEDISYLKKINSYWGNDVFEGVENTIINFEQQKRKQKLLNKNKEITL